MTDLRTGATRRRHLRPRGGSQAAPQLLRAAGIAALLSPLAIAASCGNPAAIPGVTTTELARRSRTTSGGAIATPRGPLEAVATRYDIPSGASLPPHLHPSPRYAFVQSGALEVTNVRTGVTHTFHAGDLVVEDVNVWHKARNAGAESVRLLVLDIEPPGTSNVVKSGSPRTKVQQ